MKIKFDPTKWSITARLNGRRFYAEITDFPLELSPLILDEVRLYTASDHILWLSKDRKRINHDEASGQTFEPKPGDREVLGNLAYVIWELGNWMELKEVKSEA